MPAKVLKPHALNKAGGNQLEDPGYRQTHKHLVWRRHCNALTRKGDRGHNSSLWTQDKTANSSRVKSTGRCVHGYPGDTRGQRWLTDHLCSSSGSSVFLNTWQQNSMEYLKFCLHLLTLMVNPGTSRLLTFAQKVQQQEQVIPQTLGRETMTHSSVLTFVCDKHLWERGWRSQALLWLWGVKPWSTAPLLWA